MIVPFTTPDPVGVAVALMVQLSPAPKVAGLIGQLCVSPNGEVATIDDIVTAVPPLFVKVIEVAEVVVPTSTDPKFTVCGARVIAAGSVPVPVSVASVGEFGEFEATARFADCVPEVVGLKNTVIAQVPAGAIVAEQLLLCENDELFVPFKLTTIDDSVTFPVLVTVKA